MLAAVGAQIEREAQLPADALVAAQERAHLGQVGEQTGQVAAVLGVETSARSTRSSQVSTSHSCPGSCSAMRSNRRNRPRRLIELVAGAADQVQRLGRDVAVRARQRRRRARGQREVAGERDAERGTKPRWRRGRRGPWPARPARSTTPGPGDRRRQRRLAGQSEPLVDGALVPGQRRQRRAQALEPRRDHVEAAALAERARHRRRRQPGHEVGEVAGGHAGQAHRPVLEAVRDRLVPLGGRPDARQAQHAVDLGLEAALAAAQLDDLDVLERAIEIAR